MKKNIPDFETEGEEREFWATADSTEYVDWSSARRVTLVNLKPTRSALRWKGGLRGESRVRQRLGKV